MSSVVRLLRTNLTLLGRRYDSSLSSTNLSFKAAVRNVYSEQDYKALAENFTKSSENSRFRRKRSLYDVAIRRLAHAKQFDLIEQVIEGQRKYENGSDERFLNRLIRLYGRAGMPDHARKLFDELPKDNGSPNVESYNVLLSAYLESDKFDEVDSMFRNMQSTHSIQPDTVTYNIEVGALCKMGNPESAVKLIDEMKNNGLKPNSITFGSILKTFYDKKQISEAEKLWDKMEENDVAPDIFCFNEKMGCLIHLGKIEEAAKIFEEIQSRELKPNIFTFNVLIKGYCQAKNLEGAKKIYHEFLKSKISGNQKTYDPLISFSCEMGDFKLAQELCVECLTRRRGRLIDVNILKRVVDALVKESEVEKAEKIVKFAVSRNYPASELQLNLPKSD